jgi:RHS repeat-associated protein
VSRFAHGEYFESDPGWESAGGWADAVDSVYRLNTWYANDATTAVAAWAMTAGHLRGRVRAVTDGARSRNAELVFDYQDATHYKIAGLRVTDGQWVIKAVGANNSETLLAAATESISADQWYQLDLVVELNQVTLYADGQAKVTWQRGSSQRITGGRVGVMVRDGKAEFQELEVWDVTAATKYYALGGQRVALRRDGVLSYVHTDHLGSTSVLTDAAGQGVAGTRLKYYPFGAPRPDGASATHDAFATGYTDATFTGQRRDVGTGLYFYGARYYDSAIGRFVQPDTIVPGTGNLQALNRYAYTLNNPLRYSDPTGMFSEEEIMKYYGVKTWAEVLALFEKGGRLEGLWGWLETLRRSELGDRISIWDRQCTDSRCNAIEGGLEEFFRGVFAEQEGQLVVLGSTRSSKELTWAADAVALIGRTHFGYSAHSFLTRPQEKYYHVRFDKDKVDWTSVGLGVAGLGQDAGMVIAMAGAATVDPILLIVGVSMVGIGTAAEATGVLYTYAQFQAGKATGMDLTVSVSTSIFGLVPGPVGLTSSGVGILWDMHYGVSITP